MAAIKGRDTKPELLIRRGLHSEGFRFKLHDKKLPGKPDLVFPKYRTVIFVNGCFWHGHKCHLFKWPGTRKTFWRDKITSNLERDKNNYRNLEELGWRVIVVWECALKGKFKLTADVVVNRLDQLLRKYSNEKRSALGVIEISGLEPL